MGRAGGQIPPAMGKLDVAALERPFAGA